MSGTDPFDLERFIAAQEGIYETALAELRRGQKESHWMWFIFPQIRGLGSSAMALKYAIGGRDEAITYLKHPILGPRLVECCDALLKVEGKSASEVMGYPDDLKLRSSITLFGAVSTGQPIFSQVLKKYFGGERDSRTLAALADGPEIHR